MHTSAIEMRTFLESNFGVRCHISTDEPNFVTAKLRDREIIRVIERFGTGIRVTTIYGTLLVDRPAFIEQLKFGSGQTIRQFVYNEDLGSANLL